MHAMCKMIEQVVVPLIAKNRNGGDTGRRKVLEAIRLDRLKEFEKE